MGRRLFLPAAVVGALLLVAPAARAQLFRGGLMPFPSLVFSPPFGNPISIPYYAPYAPGLAPYNPYGMPALSPGAVLPSDYLRALRAQSLRPLRTGPSQSTGRPHQKIEEFDTPAKDTRPAAERPDKATAAQLEVRVPAAAEVFFDGKPTKRTGAVRQLETPALPPGQAYTYEVRARWQTAGRDNDVIRHVTVRAGDRLTVDFAPALGSGTRPPAK